MKAACTSIYFMVFVFLAINPAYSDMPTKESLAIEIIHQDVSNDLRDLAFEVNRFFGDSGKHEDGSSLILDLELDSLYSRYQKTEHNLKYRTKIRLDNLNKALSGLGKKIELVVEPNDPLPEGNHPSEISTNQATSSSIHLDISANKSHTITYQVGHNGLKSIFIGAAYDQLFKFTQMNVALDSSIRLTNNEELQVIVEPSIMHSISKKWLQTIFMDIRYLSKTTDKTIVYGGKWRYLLDAKQGLSFAAITNGTTEHGYQTNGQQLSISYRRKLDISWMYLESQLFSQWQREHDFSNDPGVSLGLNMYFGS